MAVGPYIRCAMNMPTRAIICTPEPSSGAARYVFELASSLAGSTTPVALLCPSNFAHRSELKARGIDVLISSVRGVAPGTAITRIMRNLRFLSMHFFRQFTVSRKKDILHFQFPHYFPLGLVSFLIAKLRGCRIVFTAHDPVPHKWLLPPALRFLERGSLRWAYDLTDRIVVHNEADKRLLIDSFEQRQTKVVVIPHGPFSFSSVPSPCHSSPTLDLLLFGSIREDKGLHLAIEAVQRINRNARRVTLTIAGAVANAREAPYWQNCKSLIGNAPEGITVEERYISDEELPQLIGRCHAVVLPYTGTNSESGVAALALANARPIVARNVGGLATLLKAADLGISINSQTVNGVEQAIEQALSLTTDELAHKGRKGQEIIRTTRAWAEIGQKTADLYTSLSSR